MRWLLSAFALGALVAAGAADAQTRDVLFSPILTIDQDRLFEQTRAGADRAQALEAAAAELAAENRRIEAELAAEERLLAETRESMPADEFAAAADAFDQKVQAIRAEQNRKAVAFGAQRDEVRQEFFAEVGDVLSSIVRERGAVIVLDLRDVFLSADQIDITEEAIERVNATLQPAEDGDGNQ